MTALAHEGTPHFAGLSPARGTYKIKANVRIFKGAIVGLDSAGRVMPADTIANGCLRIVGKSSATYDNRTGSVLGGAADAVDVDVEFGVFSCANSSSGEALTNAEVTKACYAVDDQTVGKTSATDTLPVAGVVTEVTGSKVYVYMGPHVGTARAATTIAALGVTSNLVGVDGTASNAAPLVGTEARLDAIEAKVDATLAALKAAGLML